MTSRGLTMLIVKKTMKNLNQIIYKVRDIITIYFKSIRKMLGSQKSLENKEGYCN